MKSSGNQTNTSGSGPTRMNLLLLRPKSGCVLEIYTRRHGVDLHYGFCRGVIFAYSTVQFIDSFRRRSDVKTGHEWSESCEFGPEAYEGLSFEFRQQAQWMSCGMQHLDHRARRA
jgi:hypothetical protein